MRKPHLRTPSPAFVVALLALFVALGGTTYAATSLPKASVGTQQLKNNAVTSSKVKNNSLTGADIRESSLGKVPSAATADELAGLTGSDYQRRVSGNCSVAIEAVDATGDVTCDNVVFRPESTGVIAPSNTANVTAKCNSGETVVGGGGGWYVAGSPPQYAAVATVSASGPSDTNGDPINSFQTAQAWHVEGTNTSAIDLQLIAYAECAS